MSVFVDFPFGKGGSGFSSVFNVRSHGAYGDGLHDDTVSIQNTVNAALADGFGGVVYFPAGTYIVTGSATGTGGIQLGSNLWIVGAGQRTTTIKAGTSAPTYIDLLYVQGTITGSTTSVSNIVISDLTIDGANLTTNGNRPIGLLGCCVDLVNADNVRILNCTIKNAAGYGVQLASYDTTYTYLMKNPVVQDCTFINNGRISGSDTLAGGRHSAANFSNNEFLNCNGTAIDMVYPRFAIVHDNHIGTPAAGGNGAIASDFGAFGCEITNNRFETGAGGIALQGYLPDIPGSNVAPINCVIAGNIITQTRGIYDAGIFVTAATELSSQGASPTNVCRNITIANNEILGAYHSAIRLVDVVGFKVGVNRLRGWNSSGTAQSVTGGGASSLTAASDTAAFLLKAGAPGTSTGCAFGVIEGNSLYVDTTNQVCLYTEYQGAKHIRFTGNNVAAGVGGLTINTTAS